MKEKQLWDKVNFTWHPRSAWGEPERPQTWNDPGFMETLEGFSPWDSREAGWLAWAGAGKATSWVWARLQEPCRACVGACRGPQSRGGPCAGTRGAMWQGLWKGYGQSEVARSQRNQVLGSCLGRAPPGVLTLVLTSPAPAGDPLTSPAVSLQHPLLRKLSIMLTLEEKCLVF